WGPTGAGWPRHGWDRRSTGCAEDGVERPSDISSRKRRPAPWRTIMASVALHSVLLFGWVGGRLPSVPRLPRQLIVLAPPSHGADETPMRYQLPEAAAARTGRKLADSRRGTPGRRAVRPEVRNPA